MVMNNIREDIKRIINKVAESNFWEGINQGGTDYSGEGYIPDEQEALNELETYIYRVREEEQRELDRQEYVKTLSSKEQAKFLSSNYPVEYEVQESTYSYFTYNPPVGSYIKSTRRGNSFVGYTIEKFETPKVIGLSNSTLPIEERTNK